MPAYIALLRGINVSGQKIIRMEELRAMFGRLGFTEVRTYVQSGNVIFDTRKATGTRLATKITQAIQRDFGFEVTVFVITPPELREIIRRNPFGKDKMLDPARLHVAFLSATPTPAAIAQLNPLITPPEEVRVVGSEAFLYCPNGIGKSKLSNNAVEKKLGVAATMRNWRTVNALLAMVEPVTAD